MPKRYSILFTILFIFSFTAISQIKEKSSTESTENKDIGHAEKLSISDLPFPTIDYIGCATGTENPPVTNIIFEQEVLDLVNIERKNDGKPPLKGVYDITLVRAARYHAKDMADDEYFDHDSYDQGNPDPVPVCLWYTRVGAFYSSWIYLLENIAVGHSTPIDVMYDPLYGWMNSAEHRSNILNANVWEIGIGYHYKSGSPWGHYWVQDFGKRTGVYPLIINSDSLETKEQTVRLYIYGDWDEMRLWNDNCDTTNWVTFQSTLNWTLQDQPGERTVGVELRTATETAISHDIIQYNPTSRVLVQVKTLLEGAYNSATGSMRTSLYSLIPCESPYSEDPRMVCGIPADAVDWILLQLRDKNNQSQIIKQKSLFLRNDGLLMDDLGNTQIQLSDVPAEDYYISLEHRNHLDVISSSTHALNSSTSVLIDFTQSGIFEGITGEKELTSGLWGLWAGDINQDGLITTLDYSTWYNAETAGTGYYDDSDIDLDSMIDSQDFILWYMNSKQGIISPLYP